MRRAVLSSLASASALALAVAGPALARPEPGNGSPGNSAAEITVEDCTVDSSKEISYVAFFSGGEELDKDETIGGESFDLSTVEGVEGYDAVEVKSGTTVEDFDIDCASDTADDGEDSQEGDQNVGAGGDEETDDDQFSSNGNSEATIELEGCELQSSKDISYVAFFSGGEELDKDETIDGESFDLSTVEGVEGYDAVEVKSGTTVEDFDIDCASDTADDEVAAGGGTEESDGSDETDETDETEGETDGEGDDDADGAPQDSSQATITVDGCTVESSKDISYIAYFADGDEVKKENINQPTFDLSTVDGIDDVDRIEVKSGETVETFTNTCSGT